MHSPKTIEMVSVIFDFKTKPNKNLEFMQAIGSIIVDLRKVKGCIGVDFQQADENPDKFCLQIDLDNYGSINPVLKNENYKFLQGALEVLCERPIVEISNGIEPIKIDTSKKRNISIKNQILFELEHNANIKNKN
jgi:quinol monooxygenase YgiN